MKTGFAALGALALLAGCGGGQTGGNDAGNAGAAVVNEEVPNAIVGNLADLPPTLDLAGEGLTLVQGAGGSREASFSQSREMVVPLIASSVGEPIAQGTNAECGAGPMDNVDFNGGLTLFFQDGKFVGWSVDGRNPTPYMTSNGIGIGSTLEALRATGDVSVQETSLGVEFTAGAISGLLTANRPDGKITNLWAGTTCAFR